jgi:hypothetical protein
VSTDTFIKMLDRIGDDPDILQDVITEQKELAQAKFPDVIRRSTFEKDHNEVDPPADLPTANQQDGSRRMANRIHR